MGKGNGLQNISVSLERIVYQNDENGFTVARADPNDMVEDKITVVGNLLSVFPRQELSLKGYWDHHSEYDRHFQVKDCQIVLLANEAGIQRYLASDFIKGIDPLDCQEAY